MSSASGKVNLWYKSLTKKPSAYEARGFAEAGLQNLRKWRTRAKTSTFVLFGSLTAAYSYACAFSYQSGFYRSFGITPELAGRSRSELFGNAFSLLLFFGGFFVGLVVLTVLIAAFVGPPRWPAALLGATGSILYPIFAVFSLRTDGGGGSDRLWLSFVLAMVAAGILWASQGGRTEWPDFSNALTRTLRINRLARGVSGGLIYLLGPLLVILVSVSGPIAFWSAGTSRAFEVINADWNDEFRESAMQQATTTGVAPAKIVWVGSGENPLARFSNTWLVLGARDGFTVLWNVTSAQTIRVPSAGIVACFRIDNIEQQRSIPDDKTTCEPLER